MKQSGPVQHTTLFRYSFSACLTSIVLAAVMASPLGAEIRIEAEDAVSTNFATESVQLFGASENRTLQLNQQRSIGDDPFYAEYAVYAPQAGLYQFWYGGSLPGSADTLLPSYGSPFQVIANDQAPISVIWEAVAVGPTYSTPYRLVRATELSLVEGLNRIRIEVTERRRFDARFFLYLDELIFVGPDDPALLDEESLTAEPETIEDLLIAVRDDPQDLGAWARLADLYTLVGDHINALRYLNRSTAVAPNDPRLLQLQARNQIWQGDLDGAFGSYWQLLSADPNQLSSYLEAGKLAAWNGFYGASEQYYLAGLGTFPDSVEIQINLGFTYVWWNRQDQADEIFASVEAGAQEPEEALLVAQEYRQNEAPEEAERFLTQRLRAGDASPELVAELYDLLLSRDDNQAAQAIVDEARGLADDPVALSAVIARVDRTVQLRQDLLAQYEEQAAESPLSAGPRRTLAQTYLWIGRRPEGIRQYEHLLALQQLSGLRATWDARSLLIERATTLALARRDMGQALAGITPLATAVQDAVEARADLAEEATPAERNAADAAVNDATVALAALQARVERLSEWIGPNPEPPDATAARDEAISNRDSLLENAGWEANTPRTLGELRSAQGTIPAVDAVAGLTDWLIGEEETVPPTNTLVGSAAPVEQMLLVWAWSDASLTSPEWETALERGVSSLPPAAETLAAYASLFGPDAAEIDAAVAAGVAAAGSDAALAQVAAAQTAAALAQSQMASEQAVISELLQAETTRALYTLQTETIALRTQLGSLYGAEGDTGAAIAQFETVREVDASNLDTLFALGGAYQQMGRWARALGSYASIYAIDPGFRNVDAIHNQIARQNADSFNGGMRLIAEPSRVVVGARSSYLWKVTSGIDLRGEIDGQTTRLKTVSGGFTRRQYFEQGLATARLTLRLSSLGLELEPFAGADITGNQLFLAGLTGQAITTVTDGGDYFQNWQIRPVLGAALRLNRDSFFGALSYRVGPYRPSQDLPVQTAMVTRPEYTANSFGINATVFGSRWQTTTISSLDLVTDSENSGSRLAAYQDGLYYLIQSAQPFTRVGLGASVAYESFFGADDFASNDIYDVFYRPEDVIQANALASAQLYRPLGSIGTWGINTRVYAGLYQQSQSAFRSGGDVTLEFTRRQLAFQLGSSLSRVWDGDSAPDFYSIGTSINVVVRNPRLLAP